MGAQKSIHAGKAKIDFNVDLSHKLCTALLLPPLRDAGSPFSQIIGRLCINHPSLFGRREKLDLVWDKGLQDSNFVVAFRPPRSEWLVQQSFVIQHSVNPEIAVHGYPVDDFSRSGSSGVNLCRFSVGVDLKEPATSKWSSTTSVKFEHVRHTNDEGRPISSDSDGFPVTCSGSIHDNMVVLKQESQYADANDDSFFRLNILMEQGLPLLSKWQIFNRFKCVASKGVKLGPAFLVASLTGGSIVGDMAPYQAFALGGIGSIRGYGEGAVGSGRSCLVANTELTIPLTNSLEGVLFMDCGTDFGSARHVPGNPALRLGKPGYGAGIGYGVRFSTKFGQIQVDCATNAFQRKTVYFGINNVLTSGYMVAFAGRKYAARSLPAFVGNSSYVVTSFTLVLEFQKGTLQNLFWKRDGCSSCSGKSNFVCLNQLDCAIKTSSCKGQGGSVDCSLGIQLAFSGTDKHDSVLNSWYEVSKLRQYSLYGLYSNLKDSLTSQYSKFF